MVFAASTTLLTDMMQRLLQKVSRRHDAKYAVYLFCQLLGGLTNRRPRDSMKLRPIFLVTEMSCSPQIKGMGSRKRIQSVQMLDTNYIGEAQVSNVGREERVKKRVKKWNKKNNK